MNARVHRGRAIQEDGCMRPKTAGTRAILATALIAAVAASDAVGADRPTMAYILGPDGVKIEVVRAPE